MYQHNSLSSPTHSPLSLTKLFVSILLVLLIAACSENKSAEDFLQEAAQFSETGDSKAAVVALKNAVQLAPRSAAARFELGKAQLSLNRFDEASKELSRALDYGYTENQVIPFLAEALARSGANVELSELSYDASLLTSGEQLEVGARKVASLVGLEKDKEASALVEALLLIDAESPYKGMIKGYQFILAKNFPEALNTLKTVLEQAPLNRDVIRLTARLYILNGDIETATNLYEEYIQVAQEDTQAKFALVNILMDQNQSQRAEKYIDELLEINSNNGRLNQLKATARSVAEDHVAAKEFAEKAINGGRSDSALRLIAGFSSYQLKDYEGVIRHITVVSDVLPDDHPALRILVDSQLQLNMGEDANEVLSRVDDTAADQLLLFPRASYGLIKVGDAEAAKEMIQQAEKTGDSSEDLIRTGALKLALNDLDGLLDLEQALNKAPESYEAKSTLAGAYIVTKQIDKGMALAQKWQKEQPSMIEGYLLEADLLGMQDKLSEAAEAVKKAEAIDPTNSFVQLASIRLDMIMERYEQGLVKVESLLAKEPNKVNALASYYKIKTELGDPSVAIKKIETASKNNLGNEGLTILYASVLVADEKFNEAIDELNRIDANRFTQSTYWRLKGMALYNTSNMTELYTHYTEWVDIFPDQIDPTLGLLHILDLRRDFPQAAKVAENFLAIKDQAQIRMMAAYFSAMSEDIVAAKRSLRGIESEYQEIPYIRGIKARIALLEGLGRQVVEDAKANYLARKSSDNLALYVQTLDSAGRAPEAFPIVQQHTVDFPADARSKALFAARQVKIDSAAALASYEELLDDFPNDPGVLNNAGYLHFKANNIEKAFEYSAKANQINPTNLNYADTYAQVLLQRGETEQAVEAYNIAITDSVAEQEIILNYIEALFINNNELAAKRRIQQFRTRLRTQESKDRLFDLQVKYLN